MHSKTPDPLLTTNAPSENPVIDLNELLFDHPAANFIFRLDDEYLIVDRAILPTDGSLILTRNHDGYALEAYHGQPSWGVVTYEIKRLN